MELETFKGHIVVVGQCLGCGQKKVLVDYDGDFFCTRCIEKDDHLTSMIGWKRFN